MFKKIKDDCGITMIHALVGVLIFTVFSTIIYSSSMANMRSIESQQEYQQAYLTVSSAENIFADSLKGDYLTYTRTYVGDYDPVNNPGDKSSISYIDADLKNPISEEIKQLYQYWNIGSPEKGKVSSHKIEVSGQNGTETVTLEDVNVDIKILSVGADEYELYANFCTTSTTANNYYMNVTIPITEEVDSRDRLVESTNENGEDNSYYETVETHVISFDFDSENMKVTKGKLKIKDE